MKSSSIFVHTSFRIVNKKPSKPEATKKMEISKLINPRSLPPNAFRGRQVYMSMYSISSLKIGLEHVIPKEVCERIWRMKHLARFQRKIQYMSDKTHNRKGPKPVLMCRWGCSHIRTSIGEYKFVPSKRVGKRKSRQYLSKYNKTFHY